MAAPKHLDIQLIKGIRNCGASYFQIAKHFNLSKGTLSYHLSKGGKERQYKYRQQNKKSPEFIASKKATTFKAKKYIPNEIKDNKYESIERIANSKAQQFKKEYKGKNKMKRKNNAGQGNFSENWTGKDALEHIGGKDNAYCYLTGEKLDLAKSDEYHFDHILPPRKNGTNDLSNLGATTRNANVSKNDMTVEEYLELCSKVLEHHGYSVTPPKN